MKAALFLGPEKMEVKELEKPQCKEGEISLRVKACAVCGTDVRIYYHGQKNVKPPHIIGHEIAGVIEDFGSGIQGYEKGEPVIVVTPVGCGKCRLCKKGLHNLCLDFKAIGYHYPGGFAQYVVIPEAAVGQGNVLKIPPIPFDEASLVEPLSCCVNGQNYLNIEQGDRVAVLGAGPIGCMHAELAWTRGAAKVILADISQTRLQLARRIPADLYVNSAKEDPVKKVLKFTGGEGVDVTIVACPSGQAQEQALEMTAKKGRISFFGGLPHDKSKISLDSNLLHYKEISLFGAFASHASQYKKALSLIESRKVDARKLITHKFPLEDIVQGIEMVKNGESLKVVIEP